jgi:hypothetical protein
MFSAEVRASRATLPPKERMKIHDTTIEPPQIASMKPSRPLIAVFGLWGFGSSLPGAEPGALQVISVLHDESALADAHDLEGCAGLACIAGKGFTKRNLLQGGVFPNKPGRGGCLAIVDVKPRDAPKILRSARDPLASDVAETVLPLGANRWLNGTHDLDLFYPSDRPSPKQLATIEGRPHVDTISGFARPGDEVFAASKEGHIVSLDVSAPATARTTCAAKSQSLNSPTRSNPVLAFQPSGTKPKTSLGCSERTSG